MGRISIFYHRMGSPRYFYSGSARWIWGLYVLGGVCLLAGLIWGLFFSPPDRLQGDSVRIMYMHVPAAHLAQLVYIAIAVAGAVWLIWRIKLADVFMASMAPIGAGITSLALISGILWGIPTWGTGWVWDARITSTLILLFLYVGLIALRGAFRRPERAALAIAILALVGAVNIPIIKYSVEWFATLHQPASIVIGKKPTIAAAFLWPLLLSAVGFHALVAGAGLASMRAEVIKREARAEWVLELLSSRHPSR